MPQALSILPGLQAGCHPQEIYPKVEKETNILIFGRLIWARQARRDPRASVAVVGLEGKHSSRRKIWGRTGREGKRLFPA